MVNGVESIIAGEHFLAEDGTLTEGTNLILAEGTDISGAYSDTISLNLDISLPKFFTYDKNGSIVSEVFQEKEIARYGYDYENRLISASLSQGTETTEAVYKYDYLGRRIEKDINGVVTKYIYDGNNVIAEYNGSGEVITRYIYGPGTDEPIRLENQTNVCYYHYNALGSVIDLTDDTGQHIEHYYYSPFGKTKIYNPATSLKREESIVGNPYRFTARRWDSESRLYYYRARMYDPELGRFLQTDPVGYDAGDLNLYRYCGNNPVNFVDPTGHIAEQIKNYMEALKNAWREFRNHWGETFKNNVVDPFINPKPWPDPDKTVSQNWLEGVYDVIMPGGSLNPGSVGISDSKEKKDNED